MKCRRIERTQRKGKQPRRKTTCLLPSDIVEKIDSLFDGRNRDDAISLVNKVYSSDGYTQTSGVLLSSNYYKKCLRKSATERVFITLRDNNILELTRAAIKERNQAAWYRVNSIDHCDLQEVEFMEVFQLSRSEDKDILCRKVGEFVNELGDLASKTFIEENADEIIAQRIDSAGLYNFPNGDRKNLSPSELDYQRAKIIRKHSTLLKQIKDNHTQERLPKRNATNNRMNYTLTGLSSKYHEKLVWRGKETLDESDLSNSQPVLLMTLLEGRFTDRLLRMLSCDNYKFHHVNSLFTYNSIVKGTYIGTLEENIRRDYLVGSSSFISTSTHNTETLIESSFSVLTKSSKLYKYICDKKGWDINTSEHKKRAKEYVFGCIYGSFRPTKEIGKSRRKFMKEHFPEILSAIDKIKKSFVPHFQRMKKDNPEQFYALANRNGERRTPSKMASNALSILLQRLEAYLFIDKILKECIRRGIPCAPKHDSLLYPKSFKPRVERVMIKILDQYLGEGNYSI